MAKQKRVTLHVLAQLRHVHRYAKTIALQYIAQSVLLTVIPTAMIAADVAGTLHNTFQTAYDKDEIKVIFNEITTVVLTLNILTHKLHTIRVLIFENSV